MYPTIRILFNSFVLCGRTARLLRSNSSKSNLANSLLIVVCCLTHQTDRSDPWQQDTTPVLLSILHYSSDGGAHDGGPLRAVLNTYITSSMTIRDEN